MKQKKLPVQTINVLANNDSSIWWVDLWKQSQWDTWTDAKGWLWDNYKAQVYKTKQGFCIEFLYPEEAVEFNLQYRL